MIPLSTKMRPRTLKEFVGQEHFLYKGSLLYNAIKNKTFENAIFFGPSGTGKTTLARIIAREMDADFIEINAGVAGIKELKEIIENAELKFFGLQKQKTYVYVDEFHRWNKLQQDTLLKALEDGVLSFIGSTTENPYFAINNAVLSRVHSIYEFKPHTPQNICKILKRTLSDDEKGFGRLNIKCDDDVLMLMAKMNSGDARVALDTLGFIIDNMGDKGEIDEKMIEEAMQQKAYFYHKEDDKYDLLSALQKSIRGSDPDAAIHYLARLIKGGADIKMISRRLLVIASEDVGMAYPQAISIVNACVQAALIVGYPEAQINLAQAVITMAAAPKSNRSYMAFLEASSDLEKFDGLEIPLHIRDSHYSGASKRGIGIGYKYPHDYGGYVKQQYLPDALYETNKKYYEPTNNGTEKAFKQYLEEIKKRK